MRFVIILINFFICLLIFLYALVINATSMWHSCVCFVIALIHSFIYVINHTAYYEFFSGLFFNSDFVYYLYHPKEFCILVLPCFLLPLLSTY